MKKPAKTRNRTWAVLAIAGVVITVSLVAVGLINAHIYRTGDIRYQLAGIGSTAQIHVNLLPDTRYLGWEFTEDDLWYFENEEDAFYGFLRELSRQQVRDFMSREVVRFYDDQALFIIISGNVYSHRRVWSSIRPYLLLKDGNMVSDVFYFWGQSVDANAFYTTANFYDEDRVARDIVWSFTAEHVTSRANGGIPIYYGAGVGSPPAYISILGYQPDSIFPFQHNDNDYFFWYFRNPPPLFTETFTQYFTEEIEDGVNIPALRLGDVITAFDIQIIR